MGRCRRKIPIGWESYDPMGALINGTRIFAFKAPLKPELQHHICKSRRFTTADFFRMTEGNGKSLGLVINCSNTRRYYDSKDISGMGIEYKELFCPGRGFLLRSDLVKDFIQIVDEFLANNSDNDLLIAVHCSDGVNRSGYLICSYLISKLGWSSHDAMNAFESARCYPIQRGSYIQALHKTYSDRCSSFHPSLGRAALLDEKIGRIFSQAESLEQPNVSGNSIQQFLQIEQQFKQVAKSTCADIALPYNINVTSPPKVLNSQSAPRIDITKQLHYQAAQDSPSLEPQELSDDEGWNGSSPNIDFESMGRVDSREAVSKSQQRRQRRLKREKMFSVMKRGHFWEINAMRNE